MVVKLNLSSIQRFSPFFRNSLCSRVILLFPHNYYGYAQIILGADIFIMVSAPKRGRVLAVQCPTAKS